MLACCDRRLSKFVVSAICKQNLGSEFNFFGLKKKFLKIFQSENFDSIWNKIMFEKKIKIQFFWPHNSTSHLYCTCYCSRPVWQHCLFYSRNSSPHLTFSFSGQTKFFEKKMIKLLKIKNEKNGIKKCEKSYLIVVIVEFTVVEVQVFIFFILLNCFFGFWSLRQKKVEEETNE